MPFLPHADILNDLHRRLNRREYVSPDPLQFLYEYEDPADQEVVALVASSLAYGRVKQILASVRKVLDVLGESPAKAVRDGRADRWRGQLGSFKHRFADAAHVTAMLAGTQHLLRRHATMGRFFESALTECGGDCLAATAGLVDTITAKGQRPCGHLLPDVRLGSPCKRLALMLRWMVRSDEVDVGCWKGSNPAGLIVPLDTHMYRIGRAFGAIARRSPDMRAAVEMTRALAKLSPDDPVKYDFALTRLGIRSDMSVESLFEQCGVNENAAVP